MRAILCSIYIVILLLSINCSASKVNNTSNQSSNENSNLDSALDDLTSQIITSLSEVEKTRIAVFEFVDLQGKTTDFGRFIAEELITRLYRTQKFQVIERQLLNKILAENKLASTGLLDESSVKRLGKILGVDAIASGSVTELTNSVKVNSRLFSTETGSIFAVASVEIYKSNDVKKLMGAINNSIEEISDQRDKGIFYNEDFSTTREGMLPPNWSGGEKLMVKNNYVTDFELAKWNNNHKVTVTNINFPDNFEMQIKVEFGKSVGFFHDGEFILQIGNVNIKVDLNGKCSLNDNKGGEVIRGLYRNREVQIAVRKEGNIFKLKLDGAEILISRINSFKTPTAFTIEIATMTKFKILGIKGIVI